MRYTYVVDFNENEPSTEEKVAGYVLDNEILTFETLSEAVESAQLFWPSEHPRYFAVEATAHAVPPLGMQHG